MKLNFPPGAAETMKWALANVQKTIRSFEARQIETFAELQKKVELSFNNDAKTQGILEFDIFEAVRTYDLLDHILKTIAENNEVFIHEVTFLHVIGMALLQNTLKYGIINK